MGQLPDKSGPLECLAHAPHTKVMMVECLQTPRSQWWSVSTHQGHDGGVSPTVSAHVDAELAFKCHSFYINPFLPDVSC